MAILSISGPVKSVVKVNLLFPDVVVDQFGNKGFWTIIYNQVSSVDMCNGLENGVSVCVCVCVCVCV